MKGFLLGFYIALLLIAPMIHKLVEQLNDEAQWSDGILVICLFASGWTLAVFFAYYGWV